MNSGKIAKQLIVHLILKLYYEEEYKIKIRKKISSVRDKNVAAKKEIQEKFKIFRTKKEEVWCLQIDSIAK